MTEPVNIKRVKLIKGQQGLFIKQCQNKLFWNNNKLAKFLNISVRTLTDWKKEKFLIPLKSFKILSQKANINLPKNFKAVEQFWYTVEGGKKGGKSVYRKYGHIGGNLEYRKQCWLKWWHATGSKKLSRSNLFTFLPWKKPKQSEELAELFGIIIGDGSISNYQVCITLHLKDDIHYSKYVVQLTKKLFNIKPGVNYYPDQSVLNIVISRKGIVTFLNSMGLPIGNKIKNNLDILNWIKKNKKFTIACLRGLFDTDGCFFNHRYKVNKKIYNYIKIGFSSSAERLLDSVYNTLKNLGFNPYLRRGKEMRLESQQDVKRYLKLIGTNNSKYFKKINKML